MSVSTHRGNVCVYLRDKDARSWRVMREVAYGGTDDLARAINALPMRPADESEVAAWMDDPGVRLAHARLWEAWEKS